MHKTGLPGQVTGGFFTASHGGGAHRNAVYSRTKKLWPRAGYLGACTQRVAVGGDSPPGCCLCCLKIISLGSVCPLLFTIFAKYFSLLKINQLTRRQGGSGSWRLRGRGQIEKAPSGVARGLHSEGLAAGGDSPPGCCLCWFKSSNLRS